MLDSHTCHTHVHGSTLDALHQALRFHKELLIEILRQLHLFQFLIVQHGGLLFYPHERLLSAVWSIDRLEAAPSDVSVQIDASSKSRIEQTNGSCRLAASRMTEHTYASDIEATPEQPSGGAIQLSESIQHEAHIAGPVKHHLLVDTRHVVSRLRFVPASI